MPHSTCIATGCNDPASAEYCPIHAGPGKVRRGRRHVWLPEHPLSPNKGDTVYARLVLWDKLGRPTTSTCHWCSTALDWLTDDKSTWVEADHVNFDPLDDRPDNLVPSCRRCNMSRSNGRTSNPSLKCWKSQCARLLDRSRGHIGACPTS